jgi:peptidoglycan hydrolase-like protein with peptidoglycan-binding domain
MHGKQTMKNVQSSTGKLAIAVAILVTLATFSAPASAQTKAGSTSGTTRPKPAASTPKTGSKTARAKVSRRPPKPRGQTVPTKDRVIEIQQALAREGFYSGTPSGKWDAPTSVAMSKFQTANGLTPTGKLGALSLQKLGLGSEIAGKAAPNPQADPQPPVLSESELDTPDAPDTKEQ